MLATRNEQANSL